MSVDMFTLASVAVTRDLGRSCAENPGDGWLMILLLKYRLDMKFVLSGTCDEVSVSVVFYLF